MKIKVFVNFTVTYIGTAFSEEMPQYANEGAIILRDDPFTDSVIYDKENGKIMVNRNENGTV